MYPDITSTTLRVGTVYRTPDHLVEAPRADAGLAPYTVTNLPMRTCEQVSYNAPQAPNAQVAPYTSANPVANVLPAVYAQAPLAGVFTGLPTGASGVYHPTGGCSSASGMVNPY